MSGSQQRRTPPTQEEPLSKKAKTGQPPQQEAQDDEEDPQFSAALDLLQHSSFDEIDQKLGKLQSEFQVEVNKLEKQFAVKKAPLYKQRSEILKKIPGFWKRAFEGHGGLQELFQEVDRSILGHITDFSITEDDAGFKLEFTFSDNQFFKNKTLSKSYKVSEDAVAITATPVQWSISKEKLQGSFFLFWFDQTQQGDADEVADLMREEIWPKPAYWFLGLDEEGAMDDEEEEEEEEDQ